MNPPDDLLRENRALRERLALLSQASLSINESLDFDTVLQGGPGLRPLPGPAREMAPPLAVSLRVSFLAAPVLHLASAWEASFLPAPDAGLRLPFINRDRWPGEMPASRASWFWEMSSWSSNSHTATGLGHTRGAEGPVSILHVRWTWIMPRRSSVGIPVTLLRGQPSGARRSAPPADVAWVDEAPAFRSIAGASSRPSL